MVEARVAKRRRGGLLRHRDFRLLWAGQSTSDVGTAVSTVVLPLIAVVYLHATAFAVGALAAAEWLPWLLIGLPAGVWVDRSRCRPLMLVCDVIRAAVISSVPIAAAFGVLGMPQLFAIAAVTGFATVVFQVAYVAYLPSIVERDELVEGNAKLQGSGAVAQVVGPGIGGVLVQVFRAPFALVADGARYVATDPLLRVMTISPAVANFFFTGFEAIVVLFLVRTVHLEPGGVGLLIGLGSLGSVLGAALARPVGRRIGTSRAVWLVMLVTTPFWLLIPLTTRGAGLVFFLVGNIVMFVGVLIYNVTISSFRQAYCPPQILGRVVATMRFVLFGTIPLGALAGGALAGAVGARDAMWVLTAGQVLPAPILLASPLRKIRDLPDRPAGLAEVVPAVPHT